MDVRCTAHFRLYCPADDCVAEQTKREKNARHPDTSIIFPPQTSDDGSHERDLDH